MLEEVEEMLAYGEREESLRDWYSEESNMAVCPCCGEEFDPETSWGSVCDYCLNESVEDSDTILRYCEMSNDETEEIEIPKWITYVLDDDDIYDALREAVIEKAFRNHDARVRKQCANSFLDFVTNDVDAYTEWLEENYR